MRRISIILLITMILVSFNSCAASRLQFLDEETKISYAAQYSDVQVLISEDGNCYIRGGWISKEKPFGLANARTYEKFIDQTFPFSEKINEFVLLYDGGNAKKIILSYNGGVIITDNQELLLFYGTEKYLTPTIFTDGVIDAKLVDDKIYIVKSTGDFGYYSVDNNNDFTPIVSNVQGFDQSENIFLIHTNENELIISNDTFTEEQLNNVFNGVIAYSINCSDCLKDKHEINIGYVTENGDCFYKQGYNTELETFQNAELYAKVATSIQQVSVYAEGVILLDKNNNALIYGNDLINRETFFDKKLISEKVSHISGDHRTIFIIREDGSYVYFGGHINGRFEHIGDAT